MAGIFLVTTLSMGAAAPGQFSEIYDLLRAHLPGVDDAILDRAAVTGLLSQFQGRVSLAGATAAPSASESKDSVQTRFLEDRFAYLRVSRLDGGAGAMSSGLGQLMSSNQVKGGILDLRFSQGRDFASAAAAASLLVSSNKALLDWGDGVKRAESASVAGGIPWVVLVNSETAGSPEALAATLRQTETALLVGAKTAGQAATSKEFPLKNGDRLLIASEPVKTGDGKIISSTGLVPDIEVKVDLDQERNFWNDALKAPSARAKDPSSKRANASGGDSSRGSRRRVNEADLVRMQKEGKRTDGEITPAPADPSAADPVPGVQDPALNRALDLLKGLAVVKQLRQG